MTKEDRKLLIKDLCSRLPYGLKCYNRNTEEDFILSDAMDTDTEYPVFDYDYGGIEYVQPYLRPMADMTENEEKEIDNIIRGGCIMDGRLYTSDSGYFHIEQIDSIIQYMDSHFLDHRGLIMKGLALEAPKDMYRF